MESTTKSFSLAAVLQSVWETFKYHSNVIAGIFGIWGLLSYLPTALIFVLEPNPNKPTAISMFLILVFLPVLIIIKFGFIKVAIHMQDRKPVRVFDVFSLASIVYKYVLGWLLYVCIVGAGLLLFIVPGVIWAVRFNFFGYILAENPDIKIFDALRQSFLMTAGNTRTLIKFLFFFAAVELASLTIVIIGPLIASVVITLSVAHLFRMLQAKKSLAVE